MSKQQHSQVKTSSCGAIIKDAGGLDVLLGRGKKVAEWPGNVEFRKLVYHYRKVYASAPRNSKTQVALQVVNKIHGLGGRFIEEAEHGNHRLVSRTRMIEKVCQALREKKFNFPKGFKRPKLTNNPEVLLFLNTKEYKKPITPTKPAPTHNLMTGSKLTKDVTITCHSDSEVTAETAVVTIDEPRSPAKVCYLDSSANRAIVADASDMIGRLENFLLKYKHCAVAPGWEGDQLLSDWCIHQRQMYRCAQAGFISPKKQQHDLFDRLKKLGFVWDYEAWHWEIHFQLWSGKDKSVKADGTLLNQWLQNELEMQRCSTAYAKSDRSLRLKKTLV